MVKQLSSVERQCWKNAQFSRREYVKVVGIPSSVDHDQLEPAVRRILHHIDLNISGDIIEGCRWLGESISRTIVKFSIRKDCEHTMHGKKDLKDVDATDLDLLAGTIIEDFGMKPRNCRTRKKYFLILLLMILLG